jgi:hypothetical protein
LQKVATDLFGAETAAGWMADGEQVFVANMIRAVRGEFFSKYRAIGSGATSDKEAQLFLDAMPSENMSALQAAGMTQVAIKTRERAAREMEAKQQFMLDNMGDSKKLLDPRALDEAMQSANEGYEDSLPVLDARQFAERDATRADVAARIEAIGGDTVIKQVDQNGNASYIFARDVKY